MERGYGALGWSLDLYRSHGPAPAGMGAGGHIRAVPGTSKLVNVGYRGRYDVFGRFWGVSGVPTGPKPGLFTEDTEDIRIVSTCTEVADLWGPIPNPYNNIEVQASSCQIIFSEVARR